MNYVTSLATEYLDRVGSINIFPTEKHKQWYEENRPVGLGIMGLADLFLRYGIAYGNSDSIRFTGNIMKTMQEESYATSENLGKTLGVPKNCKKVGDATESYRRNITTISIAPTGSIAMIADCSHGIEPVFAPSFTRIDERGEEYLYTHPLAGKDYFVSAIGTNQPSWKEQVDIVASAQNYCDSGVSKTINLPNHAQVEDVKEAFIYAWKNGIKGITVYRDGSRQYQVLNAVPTEDALKDVECIDGVCVL